MVLKPIQAAAKVFRDDFSNNLNQWTLVNGSLTYWQIDNQALYASISQSRQLSTLVPKDEFWQDMDEYTVAFVFKVFDSTDKNFVVGMRDASNFYDFHFYNNQLIVEDIRNGFSFKRSTVPFALQLNKDYSIQLLYSKEKIELLIDHEKIFTTDQSWSPPIYGGKFGLKIATGSIAHSRAYFDQIEIQEFDSRDVLFKQDDPLWGGTVYDHGTSWSDYPFIARWGCALSSAAMLLRNYGYYFFDDGKIINPLTLNQWLLNQADGYVADGLVNWLAISRLSKILSDQTNNLLPKLEFSYFSGNLEENLSMLQTNLFDQQVQIAAIPGHFFLVTDYLSQTNDFAIKDPLAEYKLLSEREQTIESLRLFKPSLTDLSYLLLVLPKGLNFSLHDELGQPIENLQIVDELISNEEEKIGENYQLIYYPKPKQAKLNLLLSTADFDRELLAKIAFFVYQQDGKMQVISLSKLLDENLDLTQISQLVVKIDYLKATETSVTVETVAKTAEELKQAELNKLAFQSKKDFETGKLSFYLFYQLNLLITSLREHLDYFFLLEKFLSFHQL